MKKTIRKPEHWQDFESLCKKLWGELWEIPFEIKKNGRLGQPQSGVDVYGVPKGKNNYFGIQAKGKDDYSNAKLDIKEIENELSKARTFEPKLEVFIIATTANKDSKTEEYVRRIDAESREKGGFKILLFCWEDIADLIENNKESFNWYVNENNFREKFDAEVFVNELNKFEETINPKFEKTITKNIRGNPPLNMQSFMIISPKAFSLYGSSETNHTWCMLDIIIKNTGSIVIEDWKLHLEISNNVEKISDGFNVNWMLSESLKNMMYSKRTTYENTEEKKIKYLPLNNSPLIQSDTRTFSFYIKAFSNREDILIKWNLLARDFSKNGNILIKNQPIYIEKIVKVWTSSDDKLKDDEEIIKDYITDYNKKITNN